MPSCLRCVAWFLMWIEIWLMLQGRRRFRLRGRQDTLNAIALRPCHQVRPGDNGIIRLQGPKCSTVHEETQSRGSASTAVVNSCYDYTIDITKWSIPCFIYNNIGGWIDYNTEVTGYNSHFIPTTCRQDNYTQCV